MGLYHSPNIVADGLVLALDPSSLKSYAGTGTSFYDLSGNSNNGTVINGAVYSTSLSGYFNFDGSNDYVNVPHSSSINIADNFTVSFWSKQKTNTAQVPLSKYQSGVRGWVFVYNNTANLMSFDGRNQTGDGYKNAESSVPAPLGVWNHYTGVKSGVNMIIYQNGVATGSTTWSSAGDMTTTSNLTVGSLNGTFPSACDVGQILYYNRVLTDDEIMQNYDATKNKYNYEPTVITDGLVLNLDAGTALSYGGSGTNWYDTSGSGYILGARNSPTFTGTGISSYFTLNGSNQDFYLASYGPTYTEVTYNLWVWRNGAQNGYAAFFMSRGNATGFTYQTAGGTLSYHWINAQYTYSSGIDTTNQTWTMATLVVTPTEARWYLDGVLRNTRATSHAASAFDNIYIGSDGGQGGRYYNGRIAMVQLYNRALTNTEILQNFNATRGRYGV
jgi:hypothetical protein